MGGTGPGHDLNGKPWPVSRSVMTSTDQSSVLRDTGRDARGRHKCLRKTELDLGMKVGEGE
jgi:hypothetical protein